MLGEVGVTVTFSDGDTVTVTLMVSLHPDTLVPIKVYVVVEAGLAVTVVPVVALNPVPGDHA